MEQTGFWSRVGHWFKGSGTPPTFVDEASRGLTERQPEPQPPEAPSSPSDLSGHVTVPASRTRRLGTGGVRRLEEEHDRVVNLVEVIQTHLAAQACQTEKIADSLERLVENLAHLPAASEKQLALLASLGESATADAASAKRIEEGLAQLPPIADAQREALVSVGRNLDLSRETTERLGSTMEQIHSAIGSLGEATEASTKASERWGQDAAQRRQRVTTLLEEQSRRLTIFAWSAVTLAGLAAVIALVALFR